MTFFANIYDFIYNNLFVITIILGLVLIGVLIIKRFYTEYSFNKRLITKKRMLRNFESFQLKNRYKKIMSTFVPVVLLTVFIGSHFISSNNYDEHTMMVNNEESIFSLYEDFNNKFYSESVGTEDANALGIMAYSKNGIDQSLKQPSTNIDYIAHSNNNIHIINQDAVEIFTLNNQDLIHTKTIEHNNDNCEPNKTPVGVFVYEELFVTVNTKYMSDCNEPLFAMHNKRVYTTISVFDTNNDYELIDHYSITGHLTSFYLHASGMIQLTTKEYIPLEDGKDNVLQYLPTINHKDLTIQNTLEEVRYIEQTKPNNFSSVVSINLSNQSIDIETILHDFQHSVYQSDQDLVFVQDSYIFSQASELFELKNPVQSISTAITSFSFTEPGINYNRTIITDGEILPHNKLFSPVNDLVFFNESDEKIYLNQYNSNLDLVNKKAVSQDIEIEKSVLLDQSIEIVSNQGNYHIAEAIDNVYRLLDNAVETDSAYQQIKHINTGLMLGMNLIENQYIQMHLMDNENIIDSHMMSLNNTTNISLLENVIFDYEHSYLFVPVIETGRLTLSSNQLTVDIFNIDDEINHVISQNAFNGYFNQPPFVYRAIIIDKYIIHMTPSEIAISDIDNLSEIIQSIQY